MEALIRPGAVLLGKYRVESVLGKGGMGYVVAARHLDLDELRAIKLLLPQALRDPHAEERFLREARNASRLRGEHVARVHDIGRLPTGELLMVLEFLSGADLRRIVEARGPLPAPEAATYAIQASTALAEAHALGIIHRDIKPANLFLTRRPDGSPCVKVLDFGISKQLASGSLELTATGTLLGSPLYMSPEQMVGTKEVGPRSDIWAMGVVLYELVTGIPPFRATTAPELVELVLRHEATPPSRLRPGLPAALDGIVARCLQKRPEHRYERIEDLSAALEGLLGGARRERVSGSSTALQPTLPAVPASPGGDPVSPPPAAAAAAPPPIGPEGPPPAVASTSSAWGQTGAHGRPTTDRRARAIASAVLGVSAISAYLSWFTLHAEPDRRGAQAAASSAASAPAASSAHDPPVLPKGVEPSRGFPGAPSAPSLSASASPPAKAEPPVSTTPAIRRGRDKAAPTSVPRSKPTSSPNVPGLPSFLASELSGAPEPPSAPRPTPEPMR